MREHVVFLMKVAKKLFTPDLAGSARKKSSKKSKK